MKKEFYYEIKLTELHDKKEAAVSAFVFHPIKADHKINWIEEDRYSVMHKENTDMIKIEYNHYNENKPVTNVLHIPATDLYKVAEMLLRLNLELITNRNKKS